MTRDFMPEEDVTSTATAEPEVKEEPTLAADFDAAEPQVEPEPAEVEVADEKSASDRYVDDIMSLPVDERAALLSKTERRMEEAGDAVPWKERQDAEVAARDAQASAGAERERRQEELQSWRSNASAARANVDWIVNDLGSKWEKRELDDPAPQYDKALLEKQLDDYASAEAGLRSHGAITEIGGAMSDAIAEHGGPITEAELGQVTSGTRADKAKGFMAILAERVRKETQVEERATIEKRIKVAVDAEVGALAVMENSDTKVAPEGKAASSIAGGKAYLDMTREERAALSSEETDKLVAAQAE